MAVLQKEMLLNDNIAAHLFNRKWSPKWFNHALLCVLNRLHSWDRSRTNFLCKLSHSIIHGDYLLYGFLERFTQICSAGFINKALCMWQVEHIQWPEEQRRPAKRSIGEPSLFRAQTLVKWPLQAHLWLPLSGFFFLHSFSWALFLLILKFYNMIVSIIIVFLQKIVFINTLALICCCKIACVTSCHFFFFENCWWMVLVPVAHWNDFKKVDWLNAAVCFFHTNMFSFVKTSQVSSIFLKLKLQKTSLLLWMATTSIQNKLPKGRHEWEEGNSYYDCLFLPREAGVH